MSAVRGPVNGSRRRNSTSRSLPWPVDRPRLNDVPGVKLTKFSLLSASPGSPSRGASSVANMVSRVANANDRSSAPPTLQLGEIRARDAAVAADVDDVDPFDVVPEVIDGAGDDAAGDQRLAEAHLVGHQKPPRALSSAVNRRWKACSTVRR